MKRITILCLFILGGCYSISQVKTQEFSSIPRDKRHLIAVLDFANKTGDPENDELANGIYAKIINELNKTSRFRIIERKRIESVLKELNLQMTGLVDDKETKQLGKLLGADALLFGDLSAVKYSQNKQTIFIVWTEGRKTEVSINARIVNTETGEILATSYATTCVKQRTWVAFWFARLGRKTDKKSIIETGIELACKKVAQEIAEKAYE